MVRKGREFNEIYDLTAMRVIVERSGDDGTRDCYGALGLIHSLWKPMPGRFKDFIAMPKLNRYRALHTTVIGPEGKPLEIQIRTREMHREAEFGIAAHWVYKKGKRGKGDAEWTAWMRSLIDWQSDEADPREFMTTLRKDFFSEEVYVFTPKGEVKTLPSGATPIDFAYAVHTDVGHRTVGAKVNGRIVPLHYELKSGDFVEILTAKTGRGPSRDWLSLAASSRARNKIRQWYSRETREETEQKGRDALEQALKAQKLPYKKLQGSAVLAQVIRETGFKKAEDFYIALGSGKLQPTQIVRKVIQRLKTEEVAEEETVTRKPTRATAGDEPGRRHSRGGRRRRARPAREVLHARAGRRDPRLHLARARHHDPPRGLPERQGAAAEPGAADARLMGRRQLSELPRPGGRRLVGSPAAARGRRPDIRRARREHRRVRRCRRGPDGPEPLYRRARRREVAAGAPERATADRRRLRRLPNDAPVDASVAQRGPVDELAHNWHSQCQALGRVPNERHSSHAAAGFSAAAEVYERARPGYPDEAVAWVAERLGIGPGRDVLDLAAGTGKLTRQLVPLGARVVAVEPIDAMRAELERAVPAVEALAGTAEAIPLADGSVDAVTCAQAFHWFRPDEAVSEIRRVLRPGGGLALLWNGRDLDDPKHGRVDELLAPHRREFPGGEEHWRSVLGPLELKTWRYSQTLTLAEYVDRVASTSFVGAMAPDQRREFLDEVREALLPFDEPLELRYLTDVYVCEALGTNPSNGG